MRRVLRWSVPVDDRPHRIGSGEVLHVESRDPAVVDVWTLEDVPAGWPEGDLPEHRLVQVYGTGQPLPASAGGHVGSCVVPSARLVWHAFEVSS